MVMIKITPATCDYHDRIWLNTLLLPLVNDKHVCNHISSQLCLRYTDINNKYYISEPEFNIECSELCPYYKKV